MNSLNYSVNYSWYDNGSINQDVLYNKILSNCQISRGTVTETDKKIIKVFCQCIEDCINNFKNHDANFNFNIALKNIDELEIKNMTDTDYIGFYHADINLLDFDYEFCMQYGGKNYVKYNMEHEIGHLLVNKRTKSSNVNALNSSIGMDNLNTDQKPLYPNFIMKYYTDNMAEELSGTHNSYGSESESAHMIMISVGKNYDEFLQTYLSCDPNELIDCFEPECQDFSFVYATLDGFNKACGYGNNTTSYSEDVFRTELYNYARLNLLKNGYIKIIKNLYDDKISYDDAKDKINELKKKILVPSEYGYIISANSEDKLNDCVSQLDNIFYQYYYQK